MIIVLDTVVFVRALINPKSICGKIVFAHFSKYRLILSRSTVEEVLEVLKRPEITKKFKNYNQIDFRMIVDTILKEAEIVEFSELPTASRDPNDNKFLATAKEAHAQYLISHDNDLLDLHEFEGIEIIDCFSFVSILEGNISAFTGLAELGKKLTIKGPADLSSNIDEYLYGEEETKD